MKFTNATPFQAAWTTGYQRDGRELLIVIVKATYKMPLAQDEAAKASDEQLPLVRADEFIAEPGASAPLRETDFAHLKPACDVLLIGHARAPGRGMVKRLQVGLRVGDLVKQFTVVGDRRWGKSVLGLSASEAVPFATMPVGYERAFGGKDKSATFWANPAGRGYCKDMEHIDGHPLPNTEEPGRTVTRPDGNYHPMAFSPIGRNWSPRYRYAGTYDDHWLEHTAPFWPDDFDERYFQAAPVDQIIPCPQGGEEVVLKNLTPDGLRSFRLPRQAMPVTFIPYGGRDVIRNAVLDTIVFEPDAELFTLTWRASIALGKSVFDVKETIAGEMSAAWHRARRFPHKTYYRSLADAVAARSTKGRA